MNWSTSYALEILPAILNGFRVTLQATFGGTVLALFLGLAFAIAGRSGLMPVRRLASGISEFLRRTPLLVQLFFIFYVLPDVGIVIPALWAGILGLGLHSSAYMAEAYRAGIEAVPRGQWESARALNYPMRQTWLKIVLPQAIPPMIPALGNYIVQMFKETAILSVITVPEAMSAARDIGNVTYMYLEPVTVVGIIYLLISLPIVIILRIIENKTHIDAG